MTDLLTDWLAEWAAAGWQAGSLTDWLNMFQYYLDVLLSYRRQDGQID